jgi:hypothetical protein
MGDAEPRSQTAEIGLVLDAEAIPLEDLERTGAIEYYRSSGSSAG